LKSNSNWVAEVIVEGPFEAAKHVRHTAQAFEIICNKLDRYLSTDTEAVDDPLLWWAEHHLMYPSLLRMALDYLSIPGILFIVTYQSAS